MSHFNVSYLEGKLFSLGSQDCFQLIRDFFLNEFSIEIPDIARPNDWNPEDSDLINNWYHLSGFKKLDVDENWPPRPADVLVCTTGGSVPNHLVLFLGANEIVHHKVNSISGKELMRPAWKRYTSYILRHPDVPNLDQKKPTLDLKEAYREGLV